MYLESHDVQRQTDLSLPAHVSITYIGGYGRSGSTVLGTLLNSAPGMVHAGELSFLPIEWPDPLRRCSCRARFSECNVWGPLDPGRLLKSEDWNRLRRLESLRALPRVILGLVTARERVAVRRYVRDVLEKLSRTTGCQVLVDSSKTARSTAARPFLLARVGGADIRVIHLVRDGRKCLQSLIKTGSNWQLEGRAGAKQPGILRVSLGWVMANVSLSVLGPLWFRGRYKRIRFEDLLESPEEVLAQLELMLACDLSTVRQAIREKRPFSVGHVLGGNRLRFEGEITLLPSRSDGDSGLTRPQRFLFALTAGWLNVLYGYGW